MHFILLIMLIFIKLLWYKERGWLACLQNIYCECSIYVFVSNLTILTIQGSWIGIYLLGTYGLSYSEGWGGGGGGLAQVGDKAQRRTGGGGVGVEVQKCDDTMQRPYIWCCL